MKTHDRRSLDDQQLDASKKSTKAPATRPDHVEGSIEDLQAKAGNRAVSDLVAGSGFAVQRSFFGGAFGGLEDWVAKESSGATTGFDASMKEEPGDASMKVADASEKADASNQWDASQKDPSDEWDASQKADASEKDASQKVDASDQWDASQKFDPSDESDASQKADASDQWDASQKFDPSDKDASQKVDASDKWGASESERDLASEETELESEFNELEES